MTAQTAPFFGELYLRSTKPFLPEAVTTAEVGYLARAFASSRGPIADFGCGHGRHAGPLGRALAPRAVLGVDLDPVSLAQRERGFTAIRADLFALPIADASLSAGFAWYSTLFTFEDSAIERLLHELARCLRAGARLVLQTSPYERFVGQPEASFEGTLPDGCLLSEQSRFDPATGRDHSSRTLSTPDGRVLSAQYFIRYYPLPDLTRLLDKAGLSVVWIHGDLEGTPLSSTSTDLIIGADRKR